MLQLVTCLYAIWKMQNYKDSPRLHGLLHRVNYGDLGWQIMYVEIVTRQLRLLHAASNLDVILEIYIFV